MASLSSNSTYGGEDLLRSGSGDSRVGECSELGPVAAPPVAWWLCTFDGPAQRLGIVSAAYPAPASRPARRTGIAAARAGPHERGRTQVQSPASDGVS